MKSIKKSTIVLVLGIILMTLGFIQNMRFNNSAVEVEAIVTRYTVDKAIKSNQSDFYIA